MIVITFKLIVFEKMQNIVLNFARILSTCYLVSLISGDISAYWQSKTAQSNIYLLTD